MNTIRAQRSATSESVLPVEVELEGWPPDRQDPTSGSARSRSRGRRRSEPTSALALTVASIAAVLAFVSIATDDVATSPGTPVVERTAAPDGPPDGPLSLGAVPDGVPCPHEPLRSILPC